MAQYKVIAGLGNPGRRYEGTRHNMGFMIIDALLDELVKSGQSGRWQVRSDCHTAEVRLAGEVVYLLKPQVFMNRSGLPIGEFMRYRELEADKLIVVHDDIDLEFGRLRVKQGGGTGGHNGLKSIDAALGLEGYARLRVGVGRPLDAAEGVSPGVFAGDVADWVLSGLSKEEQHELPVIFERGVAALSMMCEAGLAAAQRNFN